MMWKIKAARAFGIAALLSVANGAVAAPATRKPLPAKQDQVQTNDLWRAEKVKNYLPDMRWPEVEEFLKRSDMVIIPVGALEQHGPSGPLGTDFYNAVGIAQRIAQKTDAIVAPVLIPGNSPYHTEFPGTITLPAELIQQVYFEAVKSLIHQGFKRFIIYNGHGGNTATCALIVDRINQETAGEAVDFDQAIAPFWKKPDTGLAGFDRHAGVRETSDSMYLTPGLVDLKVAEKPVLTYPPYIQAMVPKVVAGDKTATMIFLAETLKAKSTGKHVSTREISNTGNWSELDPHRATAAIGKLDVDAWVDAGVRFIDAWNKLEPFKRKN